MAVAITGRGGAPIEPGSGTRNPVRIGKETKFRIAMAVAAGALALCAAFLFNGLREYNEMREMNVEWEEIQGIAAGNGSQLEAFEIPEFVPVPAGSAPEEIDFEAVSGQPVHVEDDMLYKAIDLPALQELNPYVSGYIHIPGTPIDYPIMKEVTPGDYYYIDHNMYNRPDKYGAIFELSDEERGADSPITWIFGHHMSSGSMFSALYNYLQADFASTPVYIYRDGWRSEYVPFGCCIVGMEDGAYDFGSYTKGSDGYAALLSRLSGLNRLATSEPWAGADEDIVILSTCYGGAGTSNRIIVLCREARKALTPEYYNTLLEARQYGGSQEGVIAEEAAANGYGVDMSGADGAADGSPGTGSGTDTGANGQGAQPQPSYQGDGIGMADLLLGGG